MRKLFIIYFILSIFGCNRDEIKIYDSPAALRFSGDTVRARTFLFKNTNIVYDTIFALVYTSGDTSGVVRNVEIEQVLEYSELTYIKDNEGNVVDSLIDAVSGIHYVPFDDPYISSTLEIKPGRVYTYVPVILKRASDLTEKTYRLRIRLKENEFFKVDFSDYSKYYTVSFADQPIKPTLWDNVNIYSYFGEYNVVKFRFMVDVLNIELTDETFSKFDQQTLQNARNRLNRALEERIAQGLGPLYDENNKQVTF